MARSKKIKPATLKVKILLSPAGKFKLSHNVGAVYTMEAKQAKELIKYKYAIEVK